GPALLDIVKDTDQPAPVRVETIKALDSLKDTRAEEAMKLALADKDARVRAAGRVVQARLHPEEALAAYKDVLDKGEFAEKQSAVQQLSRMKEKEADALLLQWLDKLVAKDVPPEIQLDLLEAAQKRNSAAYDERLKKYEAARDPKDPLGKYREVLAGGDAENGRRVFLYKNEVYCLRCHKIQG